MTDKSKQRAKEYARQHGVTYQAAVNHIRRPLQAVLNASEREVELKLEGAASSNGARVYSKIRFADIVRIDRSGISDCAYRYALQSHLDFVVTDAMRSPLFAVEFDGRGHDGRRDALKNELCERFALPLARIDHRHMNISARGLNAVTWLAELEFTYRAMEGAQARGQIPDDEPLDPMMIYSWGHSSEKFPLDLALETRARTRRLYDAGKIPTPYLLEAAFGDGGRATAIVSLRVATDRFLVAQESIYLSGFGVGAGEAALHLAMAQMKPLLSAHLKGDKVSEPVNIVSDRLETVSKYGAFYLGGGRRLFAGVDFDPHDFALVYSHGFDGRETTNIVRPRATAR